MTPTQLIEEIKRDAEGVVLLNEWIGDGGHPVSQFLAESRANVCKRGYNGEPCPQHVEPLWWERAKHAVAEKIKQQLELKNKIGMRVEQEEEMKMCRVCGCCTSLKVFVPIKFIADHTTTEQMLSYPTFCWQRQELLKHTNDI